MPTSDDDDWANLARELEVEKTAEPPPPAPEELFEAGEVAEGVVEGLPDSEPAGDEAEELDEAESAEGEAGSDDEQPGAGRKRRRRRRRRRKGGGQAAESDATGEAGEPDGESASDEDAEPASEAEPDAEAEEIEYDDSAMTTDDELAAAEEAGGELLRELIANWNVPSWDDIVAGLHRP